MTFERRTLVVAVDGVLADTLPTRRDALMTAAFTLKLLPPNSPPPDSRSVAGQSWAESTRGLLPAATDVDETTLDLATLLAEQALSRSTTEMAPGLFPEAIARCRSAVEQGWRVVLRADSSRRVLGTLLEYLQSETECARTVASDDPLPGDSDLPRLARQYLAMSNSGVGRHGIHVCEVCDVSQSLQAREFPELIVGWPGE